jgi:hypothetical protein
MALEWYFAQSAEDLLPTTTVKLGEAGFRVQWTFDLQAAKELTPDCTCPDHGTTRCNCQFMVLLVSGDGGVQETLLVHGHDTHSWIVLAAQPGRHPHEGIQQVVQALYQAEAPAMSPQQIDVT